MLNYENKVKLKGHKLEVDLEYYSDDITRNVLAKNRNTLKRIISEGRGLKRDQEWLEALELVLENMGYDFEEDE